MLELAFSPDGKLAVYAGYDAISVRDVETWKEVHRLPGVARYLTTPAIDSSSKLIAASGEGGVVSVWDLGTRKLVKLVGHTGKVAAIEFSPDGRWLATGSHDETVKIWEAKTGKMLVSLQGHTGAVTAVAFSPDGTRLATGTDQGELRVWDGRVVVTNPAKKP